MIYKFQHLFAGRHGYCELMVAVWDDGERYVGTEKKLVPEIEALDTPVPELVHQYWSEEDEGEEPEAEG